METTHSYKDIDPRPMVATIGFFDGVHLGHRHLLGDVVGRARRMGMESTVVTFDAHPRRVLGGGSQPGLLTTNEEKLGLLSTTGLDNCVVLRFGNSLASLSAREFMESVLRDGLGVRELVIGHDNRFGHGRKEGFEDYVAHGRELGMGVARARELSIDGAGVSSSRIRRLLGDGDMEGAARLLGYPYFIHGTVVGGRREGRKMGFPTANISVDSELKVIPACGAYAVTAGIEGGRDALPAMMNIGTRPTFGGGGLTLEVHVFGLDEDLYGKRVRIGFHHRLRPERRFASGQELAGQLARDMAAARKALEGLGPKDPQTA